MVGDVAEKYRRMHKLRLKAYGVRHKVKGKESGVRIQESGERKFRISDFEFGKAWSIGHREGEKGNRREKREREEVTLSVGGWRSGPSAGSGLEVGGKDQRTEGNRSS